MTFPAAKKVSKNTLSMFLRTRCDKELYFSIHVKDAMAGAGLPVPVKRPGIGTLSVEGREFEIERNDQLVRLFPANIQYSKNAHSYNDIDLGTKLRTLTSTPAIILQGKFSISAHKSPTLQNIGLSATDVAAVPDISDFIPDVLVVRKPMDGDLAIQPNGSRVLITAE